MGWNNKHVKQRTNIVSLRMDAAFFFEKAVQSLDKYHYEKALKYFRKAAELDPDSAINHCNLAGVLSEMGSYEESNEILQHILDNIDPMMTECYFYMANNYANLELFELAEQALIRYLELDPEAQFIEECEEMMEWLSYELNRPISIDQIRLGSEDDDHYYARKLLEQGKFTEAAQKLEQLVLEDPDYIAAQNNLSLAYYCMGDFERCKQTAESVLEKDPGNLHALCNLAIYYFQQNEQEELEALVRLLKRIYPYHPELNFKLAMTLAVLGDHAAAYERFKKLIRTEKSMHEASIFHFTAVAACHIGKLDEAKRLWTQASQLDPDSQIPSYYLMRLEEMDQSQWRQWELSYHYHPSFEYHYRRLLDPHSDFLDVVRIDPIIRSSFFWALHHGDEKMKQQVIEVLALVGGSEVESVLRDYLMKAGENSYLKNLAIYALKSMGADEPLKAIIDDKEVAVYSYPSDERLPSWDKSWQEVLDLALQNMMNRGADLVQRHDLQTLWVEFLSRSYPKTPKIVKKSGWAAALEYLTAKMHRKRITYRELAEQYDVSETTIRKNVKQVDDVCGLKEKMEAIYLSLHDKL